MGLESQFQSLNEGISSTGRPSRVATRTGVREVVQTHGRKALVGLMGFMSVTGGLTIIGVVVNLKSPSLGSGMRSADIMDL